MLNQQKSEISEGEQNKINRLGLGFKFAFRGWWHAIKSERNTKIHAAATVCVVAIGLWLGLTFTEWAIIVLAIVAVWVAELINSSLEATIDRLVPEPDPAAKIAKDMAAAAVLTAAIGAGIVGLLILGPPLLSKIGTW